MLALVLSLAVLAVNAYILATLPSDYPRWWEPRPPREKCYMSESNWRGTKVARCACRTHRGEPWGR